MSEVRGGLAGRPGASAGASVAGGKASRTPRGACRGSGAAPPSIRATVHIVPQQVGPGEPSRCWSLDGAAAALRARPPMPAASLERSVATGAGRASCGRATTARAIALPVAPWPACALAGAVQTNDIRTTRTIDFSALANASNAVTSSRRFGGHSEFLALLMQEGQETARKSIVPDGVLVNPRSARRGGRRHSAASRGGGSGSFICSAFACARPGACSSIASQALSSSGLARKRPNSQFTPFERSSITA